MKGVIQKDHIPLNKFKLVVLGLPEFTFTALSGLEEELDVVTLPDRTVASGGRTGPVEFTVMLPIHHTVERAAMEIWYQEGQDPVTPTYQKPGTLVLESISGNTIATFSMPDMFVGKRGMPDFEMDNDGEMAEIEWTIHASDMLPI